VATRQVHQLITHLSRVQGRTVLLCTHNLAEAQQLCDRVAVMEHGHLLALGTPATLIRQTQRALRLELEVAADCGTTTLAQLARRDGLRAHAEVGGRIIVSGVERDGIPDLLADLVQAGVRLYRVNPQEPSLAEVYFALHEEPQP
jgi:ABC-2 type transport system ATP-binding protein